MRKRVILEVSKEWFDKISAYVTECTGAKVIKIQNEACDHQWRVSCGTVYCVRCWADKPDGDIVIKVEDVEEQPAPLKPCPSGHEAQYAGECANGDVVCAVCGWRAESKHIWNRRTP